MSREIKFRAWTGKEMIEPYSVRNGKAFIIKPCNQNDPVIKGTDGANYYKNWDVDVATDYPLMQFTGLRDANGVEIWEGDILKQVKINKEQYQSGAYCYGVVCFVDCGFLESFTHNDGEVYHENIEPRHSEVIGNIYEHPHLLDGSK